MSLWYINAHRSVVARCVSLLRAHTKHSTSLLSMPSSTSAVRTSSTVAASPPSGGTATSALINSSTTYERVLTQKNGINSHVVQAEYAVRGVIPVRAQQIKLALNNAQHKFPFERVTFCNIGNPQSLQQNPITFIRQTLAAVVCPQLLQDEHILKTWPQDVIQRAKQILYSGNGVGAYSHSKGVPAIRKRVANAIQQRDGGIACDPECLYLTNGASEGVKLMLNLIVREPDDAVLIPIPQYPLYSATMTLLNGTQVGYYLDESNGWALCVDELSARLQQARENGKNVRAIVIINPGNPTGQVLGRDNLERIVTFCEQNRLVILADEVYQKNVYTHDKPFISFKRVVCEMNSPVELASFHSVSKGVIGECGLRGGYMEVHNMDAFALDMIYKMMSVSLCANVPGQIAVDLMMHPPKRGEPSYEQYERETVSIYESLKRRANKLSEALNNIQGIECNDSEGAMYLFPKIHLPQGAFEEARRRGWENADTFYCMQLLEATGICVVPGCGFGQKAGTLHFRTTFLPPEEQIDDVVHKMRVFHEQFCRRFENAQTTER